MGILSRLFANPVTETDNFPLLSGELDYYCTKCGKKRTWRLLHPKKATFCSSCGQRLFNKELSCPNDHDTHLDSSSLYYDHSTVVFDLSGRRHSQSAFRSGCTE
jgi:DNA-directed RNA polymerase subunit RPC12/RpoP